MEEAEKFIKQLKALDDDVTDLALLDGEAFVIKRATEEDIKEWSHDTNQTDY